MKQLNRIERKDNKVPQNFMSDTYKLLDTLNKLNNSENIDQAAMLNAINDFTTSFVYFRESMNAEQSNIQALNTKILKINELIGQASEDYSNSSESKALEILETTMNEIINHLNDMNDSLQEAEIEERESKRIDAIERMFVGANTDLAATHEVINRTREDLLNIEGSMNESADSIRDGIEQVDRKVELFEKQASEFKTQCDGIVKTGQDWQKAFESWETASSKKTEESLNRLSEKLDQTQNGIGNQYEKSIEKIEKKGDDTLEKIEDLLDSAKSNLATEGFKQVFSLIGGGFTIINFILILMMFFMK